MEKRFPNNEQSPPSPRPSTQAEIWRVHGEHFEHLGDQSPSVAKELLVTLIEDSEAYDDNIGGTAVNEFKHELKIIEDAMADLSALGYKIKVVSNGWAHNGFTNVYLQVGQEFVPLLEQRYEAFRSIAIGTGEMYARRQALEDKIRLVRWFGEIHKEEHPKSLLQPG